MGKSLNAKRIVLDATTILILILLGKEWIHSLPVYTDTEASYLWMFSWPLAILLVIQRIIPRKWIRFVVSFVFLLIWYQKTLFPAVALFSLAWIQDTFAMVIHSVPDIIRMDFMYVDPILRTGLFYLLVWAVAYILYQRVIVQKKVLLILFILILYLAVLDTFLLFDGKWPVVRVFGYGFSLLALMNLHRIEGLINRRVTHLKLMPWFMAALLVLGSVSWIGYVVPKGDANWPDPVSFIRSMKSSGDGEGTGTAQSGYGKSDTRLGGSFELTENIILESVINADRYPGHYWRGESKDFYTGHGWETNFTTEVPFLYNRDTPPTLIAAPLYTEVTENVSFHEPTHLVFTSGQPLSIRPQIVLSEPGNSEPLLATVNPETHRYAINSMFGSYQTVSNIPKIDEEWLMAISEKYDHSTSNYPIEIMQTYTQLPENLPARIGRLAGEIASRETNIYQQVKNIERYLRWSGLQYRTTDVPYPEEGQDFVDQFLFETRRGYCDHFSTAMVVMLRTQGIPARWVKGYTFGEFKSLQADTHMVTVRGKNAHSWVEVYFPEAGWIPFEPTSSFSYPFEIIRAVNTVDTEPEAIVTPSLNELLQEEMEKERSQNPKGNQATAQGAMEQWKPWIIVALLLVLAGVLLYFFREGIVFRLHAMAMSRESGSRLVTKGYQLIMKVLAKVFGVRPDGQTIREYTAEVKWDRHSKEDLNQLTKVFEETRYGEKEPSLSKNEFIALWQRLLKKLRS